MLQSRLFTKTSKLPPSEEESYNARALEQGGFVHKNLAGVYSFLPLGYRVLNKIIRIIREEMDGIGGQELLLSTLQDPKIWQKTDRWNDSVLDVWFKTQLKNNSELGLATTHEEPLTELMRHFVSSYKDLPVYAYQFQTKFRNELRAKSGLIRTREFIMKDLYSFSRSEEDLDGFYEIAKSAYVNIFKRVGLGQSTFITFASGGTFCKYSHEFQTISQSGEDTIYIDHEKNIAVNKEVLTNEVLSDLGLSRNQLEEKRSVEVGNIFKLGTRFSTAFGLMYTDKTGKQKPVVMGSYGIGPGRVMGAVCEVHHDEKGVIWPETIAPYKVHLLGVGMAQSELVKTTAINLYQTLSKRGVEVLFDDRNESAGRKFADSDLYGIPFRVIVSPKTCEQDQVEVKRRDGHEAVLLPSSGLAGYLEGK